MWLINISQDSRYGMNMKWSKKDGERYAVRK